MRYLRAYRKYVHTNTQNLSTVHTSVGLAPARPNYIHTSQLWKNVCFSIAAKKVVRGGLGRRLYLYLTQREKREGQTVQVIQGPMFNQNL